MDGVQLGDLRSQHLVVGRPSPRSGSPFAHRLSLYADVNMESQKFKGRPGTRRKAVDTVHRRFATVSKRDPDSQINLPRRRAAVDDGDRQLHSVRLIA